MAHLAVMYHSLVCQSMQASRSDTACSAGEMKDVLILIPALVDEEMKLRKALHSVLKLRKVT